MSKDISNNNNLTTSVTESNIQPGLSESFDPDYSLQTSPKLTLKHPEDCSNSLQTNPKLTLKHPEDCSNSLQTNPKLTLKHPEDCSNSLQTNPKLTLKHPEDCSNFDESSPSIEKTLGSKRKNFENYEDIYNNNNNDSPTKKIKNVYDGTTQITKIRFPENQLYQRNLSDHPSYTKRDVTRDINITTWNIMNIMSIKKLKNGINTTEYNIEEDDILRYKKIIEIINNTLPPGIHLYQEVNLAFVKELEKNINKNNYVFIEDMEGSNRGGLLVFINIYMRCEIISSNPIIISWKKGEKEFIRKRGLIINIKIDEEEIKFINLHVQKDYNSIDLDTIINEINVNDNEIFMCGDFNTKNDNLKKILNEHPISKSHTIKIMQHNYNSIDHIVHIKKKEDIDSLKTQEKSPRLWKKVDINSVQTQEKSSRLWKKVDINSVRKSPRKSPRLWKKVNINSVIKSPRKSPRKLGKIAKSSTHGCKY
jgi:hypothetical protein